jgi:hypothetical protein
MVAEALLTVLILHRASIFLESRSKRVACPLARSVTTTRWEFSARQRLAHLT